MWASKKTIQWNLLITQENAQIAFKKAKITTLVVLVLKPPKLSKCIETYSLGSNKKGNTHVD